MRIEAWRLLAQCRRARGDNEAAYEALESGVSESRAVGYVWMEVALLREKLEVCEPDEDTSLSIQARINTVVAGL